jgi:GNAT superfamily N-acetyltransferase
MDLHIRTAHAGDSAALAALFEQLGYPGTAEAVAARLVASGPQDQVLVAVADERVIGAAVMHVCVPLHCAGAWGRLSALVVDAHARGAQVGAQLLRAAERWCAAQGCVRMELTSGEQRTDAHRFYLSHGYADRPKRFHKLLHGEGA